MNDVRQHFGRLPFVVRMTLPASERVLDKVAERLIAADDVLEMLGAEDARSLRWIEPHMRSVYDEVDDVMQRLCD